MRCKLRMGHEVDSMKITDDDAAFILGKGGKTKDGWIASSNGPMTVLVCALFVSQ